MPVFFGCFKRGGRFGARRRCIIKTSSAKAKGRKFQQCVRDKVLEVFPQLQADDVRSTGMGQGGSDLQLSPAAHNLFPFNIECKNQERIALWESWKQAKANQGDHIPLLFIKRNYSEELVIMRAEDFFDIIRKGDRLQGGNI